MHHNPKLVDSKEADWAHAEVKFCYDKVLTIETPSLKNLTWKTSGRSTSGSLITHNQQGSYFVQLFSKQQQFRKRHQFAKQLALAKADV